MGIAAAFVASLNAPRHTQHDGMAAIRTRAVVPLQTMPSGRATVGIATL